ncbi:MAG: M3 family oligoendopeptidase [Rhodospirillales bacterium]|nr:M3 family oligoendopeptidase [Rhodospirillales bacterium]
MAEQALAQDLPEWNLTDLYPSYDSPELINDLEKADVAASSFSADYEGKVVDLDGAALGAAIVRYEDLSETLTKVMSFAQLLFSTNMADPEIAGFYQNMQEQVTDISTKTLFFTLEINRLENEAIDNLLKEPTVNKYSSWLRDVRSYRDHQLSDELEKMLHEKHVTGSSAWVRLFEETMTALRFPVDDKELTSSEIFDMLSNKDGETRKKAAKSIGEVLGENIRTFSLITNTLAKDKEIEDKWRKFERPVSSRNLSNFVEDEVVDALVSSVTESFEDLSHRYYKLKAKWMGMEVMDYWDRNAPLPEDDDTEIPWNEAKERVLNAYGAFEPKMAEIAQQFFDKNWIDAAPTAGKNPGAFAHPTTPSAHPYVLLNYHGKTRDVMTLAHELGHGVHQVLAGVQGQLQSDTPLTLAETASVFGEMLTFRSMINAETDPGRRRVMLAGKVEDMLNTVVRQIAFFEFERRVHDERRKGELSPDRLGEIWMGIQIESLGPAFRYDEEYQYYWSYIPHFIHSPFYVYAYAFGDCLVNSLYGVFADGHPGFEQKYMEMLKAGGTLRHKELLAPFGLDASDPAFWKKGLNVISGFIDELSETI